MLSKEFIKVVSYIALAASLIAIPLPVPAFRPGPRAQTQTRPVTPRADWNGAQQAAAIGRRRRRVAETSARKNLSSEQVKKEFLDHLILREGKRNTVYRDSLGKPTVGVGHLVRSGDNLKVGDTISDARVRELLEQDSARAFNAAVEQAEELGIDDPGFVIALGSVNFQLGTGWRSKFPNTWQHMMNGNYEQAIRNIENSLWARQTPVRTGDFVKAIRRVMEQQAREAESALLASASVADAEGQFLYVAGRPALQG